MIFHLILVNTKAKTLIVAILFSVLISSSFSSFGIAQAQIDSEDPHKIKTDHPIHVRDNTPKTKPELSFSLAQSQVVQAYGINKIGCTFTGTFGDPNLCGTGQTIAIVDAYANPNIQLNLDTFSTQYNLPACNSSNGCFIVDTMGKSITSDAGWGLEESLDVEWAHAIAPGAKIILVEAPSSSFADLLVAVDHGSTIANQVSMSWGASEFSSESSYDNHFQVPGVSYFASSGDSGGKVIYPSASPYVISVGGTTLQVDSSGNRISEKGWSGSGGGVSKVEAKPSFQSTLSYSKRATPDVSYNADPNTGFPVYDKSYNGGGWFSVGGTSAGAPQWAAISAIVNSGKTPSITSQDGKLYSAASTKTLYSQNYYDITSGRAGSFRAGTGYDLVTGLGSPTANNLVSYLKSLF